MRKYINVVALILVALNAQSAEYKCPEGHTWHSSITDFSRPSKCIPDHGQQENVGRVAFDGDTPSPETSKASCMNAPAIVVDPPCIMPDALMNISFAIRRDPFGHNCSW